MYEEVLASWKGCSCARSLLDPDSFYVNKCTLLENSHHHPNSHKAKFPEPPGGAREEGQVIYDGCRSALKTILPGADGPGFPWSVRGWMDVHKQRGWGHTGHWTQQHRLLRAVSWLPPPGHSASSPTTLTSSLNLLTTRQWRVSSMAAHAGPGAPDVSPMMNLSNTKEKVMDFRSPDPDQQEFLTVHIDLLTFSRAH